MTQHSDDPRDPRETGEPGDQSERGDDGFGVRDGSTSGTKRHEGEEAEGEE